MGRRHVVKDLSPDEFDFVVREIMNGATDRELSASFEREFGKRLAKSSLNRWRKAAGDELADRYRLARFQARQLIEDLKEEENPNKYQILIRSIEDRLLTATREVISKDPVKLLQIRQEEERRRLREQELELKREQVALERERLRGSVDKGAVVNEFLSALLEYIGDDADGLRFFKRHAKAISAFLKEKYGTPQASG